jgi:hypothetical protein
MSLLNGRIQREKITLARGGYKEKKLLEVSLIHHSRIA